MSHILSPPETLPLIPDGIPAELKDLPQWVAWGWKYLPERKKWTKPPISPVTRKSASSTNPATWTSFPDALDFARFRKLPGIGRIVTRDEPYVGIDLDECRKPKTEEITSWAQAIIDRFDSYTELSPTGTGLRIIIRTATGVLPGDEDGRRKGPIAVYGSGRYFTLTGHRRGSTGEVAERTDELAAFCAEMFPPPPPRETPSPRHGAPVLSL